MLLTAFSESFEMLLISVIGTFVDKIYIVAIIISSLEKTDAFCITHSIYIWLYLSYIINIKYYL